MEGRCDLHNTPLSTAGKCARCEMLKQTTTAIIDVSHLSDFELERFNHPSGEYIISRKAINYIATYQAQCVDGNQVTANLALNDVPEGASPGSLIEIITEQAYADIARSGMNATSVLVLNLSRVW
jgi:hypothetical protein